MNRQTNHQRPRAVRHALLSSIMLATLPSTTVMAWSPSPLPLTSVHVMSPSSTSLSSSTAEAVDELYYTPNSSSSNPIPMDINAEGTTSEELEIAARNYGTSATNNVPPGAKITLTRWLSAKVNDYPELRDMESLHLSIQMACKTISNLIHSSTTLSTTAAVEASSGSSNARDNSMKRLDQISKNVLQNALRFTGRLRVVEAPRNTDNNDEDCSITDDDCPKTHQPGVTIAYALDQYGKDGSRKSSSSNRVMTRQEKLLKKLGGDAQADAKWGNTRRLAACFDPLDGSGNADAQGATGTVFGVFDADAGFKGGETPDLRDPTSLSRAVLQPGNKLLAAGYCLYSSTTMLVFTLGGRTHGFTLDQTINEFVLTHPNMKIPKRGNIYSANEAYSEGWDGKFKNYLKTLKTGRGETGQRYTQRYIGSMVGDVHRTLMYGGIFCCPSDTEVHHKGNLQLVYKSAPMAYILDHAGGKATDGKKDLLEVQPNYVHERSPCFMGSPDDMDELMTYLGDGEKEESQ